MSIRTTRFNFEWKKVRGSYKKEKQKCSRCNNIVQYELSYDGNEFGFPGLLSYKFSKVYAYKCPICPNFEAVENEVAKAIMKG